MINVPDNYLEKVAKELGAVGVFLIVSDSQIPCPDVRSGGKCEHPHYVGMTSKGIDVERVPELVKELAGLE